MTFNLNNSFNLEDNYQSGLLPQRNDKNLFYSETSCRSDLKNIILSSENRRIIRKTEMFSYEIIPITFNIDIQKQIFSWLKILKWDFPISSVKTIFSNHIFNFLYVWKINNTVVAYSICLFTNKISHIAYVFYNPEYSHSDLPIRLVLQFVIDSADKKLEYAYLGRFANYKKNMPGFENFNNNQWTKN